MSCVPVCSPDPGICPSRPWVPPSVVKSGLHFILYNSIHRFLKPQHTHRFRKKANNMHRKGDAPYEKSELQLHQNRKPIYNPRGNTIFILLDLLIPSYPPCSPHMALQLETCHQCIHLPSHSADHALGSIGAQPTLGREESKVQPTIANCSFDVDCWLSKS